MGTWELGNLGTCKLGTGNLGTWELGKLETLKLVSLAT